MVTHGSSRVAHLKPHDRNIGLSLGLSETLVLVAVNQLLYRRGGIDPSAIDS